MGAGHYKVHGYSWPRSILVFKEILCVDGVTFLPLKPPHLFHLYMHYCSPSPVRSRERGIYLVNMKQKIVMKTEMKCQKCRSKALQIVAEGEGVDFVGIEGDHKDKLVVIGDGVDAIKLTCHLRKKVGYTDIISISEVKSK